jgi:hypothetical protein
MSIQNQQDTTFVNEQEAPSNNPQWHAPVLNVYSAEDAESSTFKGNPDASSVFS